jgi:hypothetical protein
MRRNHSWAQRAKGFGVKVDPFNTRKNYLHRLMIEFEDGFIPSPYMPGPGLWRFMRQIMLMEAVYQVNEYVWHRPTLKQTYEVIAIADMTLKQLEEALKICEDEKLSSRHKEVLLQENRRRLVSKPSRKLDLARYYRCSASVFAVNVGSRLIVSV